MNVALIQCPAWGPIPPLGPAALKAYVVSHGHEARCFDFNLEFHCFFIKGHATEADLWDADGFRHWEMDHAFYYRSGGQIRFQEGSRFNVESFPLARWAEEVLAFSPDIVGFTVNHTSMVLSLELSRELKRRNPELFIVFGGPDAGKDQHGLLAMETGIPDAVAQGEGEETLMELINIQEKGEDISSVQGIGFLRDKKSFWSSDRPLIRNLDSLPFPDFSDFSLAGYRNPREIPIMSSRGCINHCAFCYECVFWKRFRTRSGKHVVDEMVFQMERHPMRPSSRSASGNKNRFCFAFGDSLVNGSLKTLEGLCDEILARDLEISWYGQATVNAGMDAALLKKLKASGCVGLAFGIESGSQRVLHSMGKRFRVEEASSLLKQLHAVGIPATVNIMVGFPVERFLDFLKTICFLRKNRTRIRDVNNVSTTAIVSGSRLASRLAHYGITLLQDGSWTSRATGTEKQRTRRLKLLHHALNLLRIPHQRLTT